MDKLLSKYGVPGYKPVFISDAIPESLLAPNPMLLKQIFVMLLGLSVSFP